jgi:hypothetical protein
MQNTTPNHPDSMIVHPTFMQVTEFNYPVIFEWTRVDGPFCRFIEKDTLIQETQARNYQQYGNKTYLSKTPMYRLQVLEAVQEVMWSTDDRSQRTYEQFSESAYQSARASAARARTLLKIH